MEAKRLPHIATVLVVDPEPVCVNFFRRALSTRGYRVVQATTVAQAIEVCSNQIKIDLIIIDFVLTDGRGTQVALALERSRPHVPVLFSSGMPLDERSRDELAKLETLGGTLAFLRKPFSAQCLFDAVRALLLPRLG